MYLDTLAGTASEVPLRTSRPVLPFPEDTPSSEDTLFLKDTL